MPASRSVMPTKARKLPKQARSGAMVDAILQAAAELLDSGSADDYTTNRIAERAGASIGSLYQYFPSKDAITAALIGQASARLLAGLERAAALDAWRDALRAMVRAAVHHQLERPGLARLLDADEARLAALDAQRHDQRRMREVLASVLQRIPGLVEQNSAGDDLMAITRALCDAAGARGDINADVLAGRVERAIFGYLEWPRAANNPTS